MDALSQSIVSYTGRMLIRILEEKKFRECCVKHLFTVELPGPFINMFMSYRAKAEKLVGWKDDWVGGLRLLMKAHLLSSDWGQAEKENR